MSRDDKARRELYPLIAEAIEKGYADIGCGFDISVAQAITPNIYNALMREGYVKASDVAREIFEEIKQEVKHALESNYRARMEHLDKYIAKDRDFELLSTILGKISALRGIDGFIDELKKKYTESENNDGD